MSEVNHLSMTVIIGTQIWIDLAKIYHENNVINYVAMIAWLAEQGVTYVIRDDLKGYDLKFDSAHHMTQFILRWL